MLRTRREAAEWMDDPAATEADFAAALRDLGRINRATFAYRPALRFLERVVAETGARRLSVLDVGCGGGDTLAAIADWGARRGVELALTGLDRSPHAARYAAARGVPARIVTADLFELDPAERFDVVLCALFTHHLAEAELVRFLGWLRARAVRGWLISDLHRHWLPYAAVWAGFRLLRLHPMVVHDGPLSFARGFVRADWERALAAAGVTAEVRWEWAFRWVVSARAA
ncbi:methyltransferase domain-containing protein [Siccirubricoccus sp. KC 17139]|uniref:Methyltransferase domain-containing protein n=1 Tax=Siccirubricoccus soli TaxID=2899147 RepID=A0ABT1D0A4_9PROT|nr:methyltransferase domain-containing protein [Siccirubricoccus soli]MCO6415344.1 methyltransferase domain-containing protein [Siccirubricoccus soli]MCP2681476.1 methyltransferase domain-containing protein [Siccirubricoccus soli]